ncbi:MAG: exonuclease SbcCD subunit D [Candidatus Limivivens sp.]|nr:exonuclease SbcCD subunit D [Candidatus Limivivens sp.]
MKIFHISDLHIGKLLYRYSLRESQEAVLTQVADQAREQRPDVIVIAGDIFDKSIPSAEAYTVLDQFLNQLGELTPTIPVLMIAGNHDSAQRLQFASSFLEKHQIYVSVMPPRNCDEHLKKITLQDEYGEVDFYLLPFFKPGYVRGLFGEGTVTDYTSAVKAVLDRENIDFSRRNVLVSHQFYQGGAGVQTCDSEQTVYSVGGLDQVDVGLLKAFDYAALGHIHGAQRVQYDHVRYSGTPLKYSVSEEHHQKGITVAELGEKGTPVKIGMLPLQAPRDVRTLRGTLEEVLDFAGEEICHDYVSVTLTDERDPWNPKQRLEEVYDSLLEIRIDNARTRAKLEGDFEIRENWTLEEAFSHFYQEMNQCPMSEKEEEIMEEIFAKVTGVGA